MIADMQFKTQPIRNLKTGLVDTRKRKARLANVKSYNLDALVDSMHRLATLPEQLTIYPGHGGTATLGPSLRMTGLI